MKLNLGCGHIQPAGWVNVDGSYRAWLASTLPRLDRALVAAGIISSTDFTHQTVHANLLKRFPWADASVDVIYMGESLEHFTFAEGAHVLAECRRVMRPGGRIRIRVPDHARFWGHYVSDFEAMRGRPRDEWTLEHTKWTRMYFDNICVQRPRRWNSMGHFHKWMYDEISLILALRAVGFANPERRAFLDSGIPGIAEVEERDDLIVEACIAALSSVPSTESRP